MRKRGVIITIVVVVAAVALIAPRFLRPKEEVAAVSLPMVSVEKPKIGSIEIQTGLTGSVEPSDMVYVIPKAAGEVTQVYVKAGDFVQEGQKLLDIDTKQVEGAKISLDTAAVSLQDANTNLQRMTVLYQSGDISRQQSSARMAKLQYDGAKLAYDNQIEFSSITAPISGLVESFNVEVHDNVAQSNTLCVISGKGTKAVSFHVTERVLGGLHVGDSITVEKNGSEYHGAISEISSMVDAATGLFKVKASLDSADTLATGAQVKLYVTSERADQAMLIPTDAVYYEGGQSMVYLYKDGAVVEQAVEVGVYDAEQTQITGGLTIEDDVIVTWSSELFEGSEVELYGGTSAGGGQETAAKENGEEKEEPEETEAEQ